MSHQSGFPTAQVLQKQDVGFDSASSQITVEDFNVDSKPDLTGHRDSQSLMLDSPFDYFVLRKGSSTFNDYRFLAAQPRDL